MNSVYCMLLLNKLQCSQYIHNMFVPQVYISVLHIHNKLHVGQKQQVKRVLLYKLQLGIPPYTTTSQVQCFSNWDITCTTNS